MDGQPGVGVLLREVDLAQLRHDGRGPHVLAAAHVGWLGGEKERLLSYFYICPRREKGRRTGDLTYRKEKEGKDCACRLHVFINDVAEVAAERCGWDTTDGT